MALMSELPLLNLNTKITLPNTLFILNVFVFIDTFILHSDWVNITLSAFHLCTLVSMIILEN